MDWIPFALTGLFGALVGITELISRYKDAPFLAISNPPALLYIFLNFLLSVSALYCIQVFEWFPPSDTGNQQTHTIMQVLLAGFGAMAFFRSSIFTVRVGDTDVGVGPSGLAQIVLDAADRAIDRNRAKPRAEAVADIMASVDFDKASHALPTYCFALMQNVSPEEQQMVARQVEALKNANMNDKVKCLSLGLLLMNLAGESLLKAAVETLGSNIEAAA